MLKGCCIQTRLSLAMTYWFVFKMGNLPNPSNKEATHSTHSTRSTTNKCTDHHFIS